MFMLAFGLTFALLVWYFSPRLVQCHAVVGGYSAAASPVNADQWRVHLTRPDGRRMWHVATIVRYRDADALCWYAIVGHSGTYPSLRATCRAIATAHANAPATPARRIPVTHA